MLYIWRHPQKVSNYDFAIFKNEDWNRCDQIKRAFPFDDKGFKVTYQKSVENAAKFDVLPNSALLPIINKSRIKEIENFTDDLRFINVEMTCKDDVSKDFFILYVSQTVHSIDHQHSDIKKGAGILTGFNTLRLHDNVMDNIQIARDKEFPDMLLVGNRMANHIISSNWKGIWLARPEELYP